MSEPTKYKAFISYSHADNKWGRWLHSVIEAYRTPKLLIGKATDTGAVPARLNPVFRDRDDLASAADLSERIDAALAASENLIVICSPNSAKSPWVNKEVEAFKKLGRSNNIFCLIVAGDPSAAGTTSDCFPPAIRERYDEQGNKQSGTAEPIAADLRSEADGKSLAKLKILAGLLNVNLDELRQRDIHRRQRRMIAITSSSIAATAITVVLAINATLARNEAEQRREQAEDLLGFMVGDLRSSLEPIGRLDLLESVGQQAMEYFQTVSLDSLSDEELLRQSQVMTQLGEIRFDQLQYEEALASFTEAFERSAVLFENNSDDGERLFNRSQAEFWVGFTHWRSGKMMEARHWMEQYLNSALELYAIENSRRDWYREVAYGYHNLGVLDQEIGNLAAAEKYLNLELDILLELQQEEDSLSLSRGVADSISWLGTIAILQGELSASIDFSERSVDILRQLLQREPDNAIRQYNLGFALFKLADANSMTSALNSAKMANDEALGIYDSLIALDPANTDWQRARLLALILEGYMLASTLDTTSSRVLLEEVLPELELLHNEHPKDMNIKKHLVKALMLIAWLDSRDEKREVALKNSSRALILANELLAGGFSNAEILGEIAGIHVFLAEVNFSLNLEDIAESNLQAAFELLLPLAKENSSHFILDPWARYLTQRHLDNDAAEVRGALEMRRYRPLIPWTN